MTTISLLFCLFVFQDNSLPIYPEGLTPSAKTPENFKMTSHGFLFLSNKKDVIWEYDHDGILVDTIDPNKTKTGNWGFSHFGFVKNAPGVGEKGAILYEISDYATYITKLRPCTGSREERDLKERRVTIPKDWTVREFISDESGLYANVKIGDQSDYCLIAVELQLSGEKYKVNAISDPFGKVDSVYGDWSKDFKRRWVVKGLDGAVYAAHELRDRLQELNFDRGKIRATDADLSLPSWKNPYRLADNKDANWRFSFSHVTGLYRMGDGLLVGYTEPDETGRDPFVLNLVYMNAGGTILGEKRISGGRLMGVKSGQRTAYVYLYEGDDNNPLEKLGPGVITNFEF